jgi:hypothetical protein
MRKSVVILLLCVLAVHMLPAVAQKPLRIEIAAKEDTDPYNLVNCEGFGAFVFFPTAQNIGKDSIVWSFHLFDINLQEKWNKGIGLDRNYLLVGSSFKARDTTVFLLFQDVRKKEGTNVVVFTVNLLRSVVREMKGQVNAMANVTHFEVSQNYAFLTTETKKGEADLCRLSLKTAEVMHFNIPEKNDTEILNLALDPVNRTVSVISKIAENQLKLTVYSYEGSEMGTVDFRKMSSKREINTAEVIQTGPGKGLVFGVYGSANNRGWISDVGDMTPLAAGYFVAGFEKGQHKFVNYYNFSEFRDFFRYVNGDDAVRLKKRSFLKGKDDNDRETSLNYHMLIHPVLQQDSSFILAGEAYYPEYHTITNMMYDYYGRPIPTSYSVFDGFRYAVAFVASFDSSGTMRWSNGMEMRGILTNLLNKKFSSIFDGKDLVMMYNAEGSLAMKTIMGNEVIEQSASTALGMLHKNDKVVKDYLSTITPWYEDFYLAYGYQSIRNNDLSNSRRNVFYINKIAYR